MHTDHSNKKEIKILEVTVEPIQSARDIIAKKPEEVFDPDFIPVYTELHQDIWRRLIRVDASIQILEIITRYPLQHLYAPQDNIFWTMVFWNFIDISVLLLHTLVCNDPSDEHTLLKFKNTVRGHLLTDSLKSAYTRKLRATKLVSRLHPIRRKIARNLPRILPATGDESNHSIPAA